MLGYGFAVPAAAMPIEFVFAPVATFSSVTESIHQPRLAKLSFEPSRQRNCTFCPKALAGSCTEVSRKPSCVAPLYANRPASGLGEEFKVVV